MQASLKSIEQNGKAREFVVKLFSTERDHPDRDGLPYDYYLLKQLAQLEEMLKVHIDLSLWHKRG